MQLQMPGGTESVRRKLSGKVPRAKTRWRAAAGVFCQEPSFIDRQQRSRAAQPARNCLELLKSKTGNFRLREANFRAISCNFLHRPTALFIARSCATTSGPNNWAEQPVRTSG
jgi:hypothetical protein